MNWWKPLLVMLAGVAGNAHADAPRVAAVTQEPMKASERPPLPAGVGFEFMGIVLGAPVVPECPQEQIPYAGAVYKLEAAQSACWAATGMRPGSQTDIRNNELLTVVPLSNKRPTGTGSVSAVVVNGVVEGLSISTDGFVHAQELFEQLKQKLGKPSQQDSVQVVSGVGAKFVSPRAVWQLPGVYVQFNGIVGDVNTGIILVYTDAGKAREAARQQQREKSF